MTEYYVGITIGPIAETLSAASRPVSLWCASSMFSWLAEDICNRAIGVGGHVISPYYPVGKAAKDYSVASESAGKYHDRIIFTIQSDTADSVKQTAETIVTEAKKALAEMLVVKQQADEALLKDAIFGYLQVHYVIEEKTVNIGKNCILRLTPYLEAAELCAVFGTDRTVQPIVRLFEGDKSRNEYVRKCFGIEDGHTALLDGKGNIRDIGHIADACPGSDRKIFNYYAVVQADGDNMGRLLSSLNSDAEIERFSEKCLEYAAEAAGMITDFGGVTIYAGGDDLLFISPLENRDGKNVFTLCSEIAERFGSFSGQPTLSFGISVNYVRFPLYEAFRDALGMLAAAKETSGGSDVKNKTAVHIRKGSGQSAMLRYSNGGELYKQLMSILAPKEDVTVLNSMLYKIGLYRSILTAALVSGKSLEYAFDNLFDSDYHEEVRDYIGTTRTALEAVYDSVKGGADTDRAPEDIPGSNAGSDEDIAVDLFCSMLRTARFFCEKRPVKKAEDK